MILLNSLEIKEEIKMRNIKYLETNENRDCRTMSPKREVNSGKHIQATRAREELKDKKAEGMG